MSDSDRTLRGTDSTSWQIGLRQARSALIGIKTNRDIIKHSKSLVEAFDGHRGVVGSGWLLMLKIDAAKKAMEFAKAVAGGADRIKLESLDAWISAGFSCGGTALFAATSPLSGGLTLTLTAMQGTACIKSVVDLVSQLQGKESFFKHGTGKVIGVGIEVVSTFGSVAALGYKAGAAGLGGVARSILRKGSNPIDRLDQFGAMLSLSAVGLSGVDAVIELTGDGVRSSPATYDHVRGVMQDCGMWSSCPLDPFHTPTDLVEFP